MTILEVRMNRASAQSCAVTDLLKVLTHKQPFNHIKHTTEVVIRSARGDRPIRPTDQRVLERGLDDNLWKLLNQCWALEATDRPDIQELIQRLQ